MNCPSPCLHSPSFSLCKQLLSPALCRNGAGQQQPHFFLWKSFYHQVWISYSVSLIQQQYKQTVMCNNQPQFSCMWWKTLVLQTGLWTSVLMLEIKIFLNWEKALILIFTFNIKEMLPELIISDALLSCECPWCLRVFYQGHRLFFFCCISTGFSTHFILLLLLHLYFSKFRGSHPAKKIKMKQTGRLLFSEHLLGKLEALYRGLMLLILFFIFISFVISIPCKGVTYWRLLRKGYC